MLLSLGPTVMEVSWAGIQEMCAMDFFTLKMEWTWFFLFSLFVAILKESGPGYMKYLRVFPSLLRLIFTCTSIHAVSSFRVLTDGRLTAVCPRNGKIPPRGSTSNTIWGAANLQRTKYKARSNRICCELNSTGTFEKDLFEKTFLLSVFELKTNCGSLLCNDFQHSNIKNGVQ